MRHHKITDRADDQFKRRSFGFTGLSNHTTRHIKGSDDNCIFVFNRTVHYSQLFTKRTKCTILLNPVNAKSHINGVLRRCYA
jgi:hypothetical protein